MTLPEIARQKSPETWAAVCKETVDLCGRLTQGADLSTEIAEAMMRQRQLAADAVLLAVLQYVQRYRLQHEADCASFEYDGFDGGTGQHGGWQLNPNIPRKPCTCGLSALLGVRRDEHGLEKNKDFGAELAAAPAIPDVAESETASRTEQIRVAIHASLNYKMRDAWIDALIEAVRVDAAQRIKSAFGAHCVQCPQCQHVALEAAGLAAPSLATEVSSSSGPVRPELVKECDLLRRALAETHNSLTMILAHATDGCKRLNAVEFRGDVTPRSIQVEK